MAGLIFSIRTQRFGSGVYEAEAGSASTTRGIRGTGTRGARGTGGRGTRGPGTRGTRVTVTELLKQFG